MSFTNLVHYLKYISFALFALLVLYRYLRTIAYRNKQHDYDCPVRIFGSYNVVEIHGTDLTKRRKFMIGSNKLVPLIWFTAFLLLMSFAMPYIARFLGIE
jgi:hypothetical protein